MWRHGETRVFEAARVDLHLTDDPWPFSDQNRDAIAAHWERRLQETPSFFNGVVHLLTAYSVSETGLLSARFVRSDFRSFLYWRETGWPDASVMDAFGSALLLSADGHLLLGRQRAGNLNSGLCYPPGGFIDARDIGANGSIDIEGSVAREILEETGLAAPAITRGYGYVITIAGPVLSIGVPYRAKLSGAALLGEIGRHISADAESELADLMLAVPGVGSDELPMPDYARALLTHLPRLKTLF